MKYSQMPKLVPRKGTSRRVRKYARMIFEHMQFNYQKELEAAQRQALIDILTYGTSAMSVTWTGDTLFITNIPQELSHEDR